MEYKIDNVDGQSYDEMVRRLNREHNLVIHSRTKEVIIGATEDGKVKVQHTKHLGSYPTVAYHRTTNRILQAGTFIVQPTDKPLRLSPSDAWILNPQKKGDLLYKNTSQYKTTWYQKHQRRQ